DPLARPGATGASGARTMAVDTPRTALTGRTAGDPPNPVQEARDGGGGHLDPADPGHDRQVRVRTRLGHPGGRRYPRLRLPLLLRGDRRGVDGQTVDGRHRPPRARLRDRPVRHGAVRAVRRAPWSPRRAVATRARW